MQDRLQVLLIGLLILASGMRGLSMQGFFSRRAIVVTTYISILGYLILERLRGL